jgi:hypothetical protein
LIKLDLFMVGWCFVFGIAFMDTTHDVLRYFFWAVLLTYWGHNLGQDLTIRTMHNRFELVRQEYIRSLYPRENS